MQTTLPPVDYAIIKTYWHISLTFSSQNLRYAITFSKFIFQSHYLKGFQLPFVTIIKCQFPGLHNTGLHNKGIKFLTFLKMV